MLSCSVVSNSLPRTAALQSPLSMGIFQARIEVCCHDLLQRLFPTQGSNLGLLHCGQIVYHLRLGRNFLISGKALISISHLKRLGLKIAASSKPEGLSRGRCFGLFLWGVALGLGGTYICPSLDHKQS